MGNIPSAADGDQPQDQQQHQQQDQQQQQQQQPPSDTSAPTTDSTHMTDDERHKAKMAKKAAKKAAKAQNTTGDDEQLLTFSADDMKAAEDDCAQCDRQCEVLEYPAAITSKIDRDFVLHDSSKLCRWNVLVTTGQSASKWAHDVFEGDSFASAVHDAAKGVEDKGKVKVSVITRGPESGANAQEVVDLFFFPEFIVYRDVERAQLTSLFQYHTTVLAPRHQEKVKGGKVIEIELDGDQTEALKVMRDPESPKFIKTSIPCTEIKQLSEFFHERDLLTNAVGTEFPFPQDMHETTFVTLCGHTLRDKRCGVTAPILREQFEIILDQKYSPEIASRVTVDLVSHVGGHKVAGNCIIHGKGFGSVFYGRVFPEHVENIVDKTIMNGEILKPIARACHNELW